MPASAPLSVSVTSRTSSSLPTHIATMSASSAASAGVGAARPPFRATQASAFAAVRLYTTTSWPAFARCRAIGAPIVPIPRNATLLMTGESARSLALGRSRVPVSQCRDGSVGGHHLESPRVGSARSHRRRRRTPRRIARRRAAAGDPTITDDRAGAGRSGCGSRGPASTTRTHGSCIGEPRVWRSSRRMPSVRRATPS